VGKGYFFLSSDEKDAIHNTLMLFPFKSELGTCMLQSLIPGFDLENPYNLAFPTWVSLWNISYEHHDQAYDIEESLGEIVGFDTIIDITKDPRFCTNLKVSRVWVINITLSSKISSPLNVCWLPMIPYHSGVKLATTGSIK
jgi:hypothetical protein